LTANLHGHFREETEELEKDLRSQIDALGGFQGQTEMLNRVETRIDKSKRKADALSTRMEEAKRRVASLEGREKDWQDAVSCKWPSYHMTALGR
jgi:phage shock protein A